MIKDIIDILKKMDSACPVECFTQLRVSPRGNLILEWKWSHGRAPYAFSTELTPEGDDCMVDLIDHAIQMARKKIRAQIAG